MSCIQYGVTIPNDVNGKLAKVIDTVANADYAKTVVLASYLDTQEFQDYVKQETGTANLLEVNGNTLRKLLNAYYVSRHADVINSINKKNADVLNGFSSARAKSIAKDHTANLIIETYYGEVNKPKGERMTNDKIIRNVSKVINDSFNTKIAVPTIKRLKAENSTDPMLDKVTSVNGEIKSLNAQKSAVIKQFNDATVAQDKLDAQTKLTELNQQLDAKDSERYVLFQNLVEKYGNVREKNYGALVSQVRGNINQWYREVFNVSKLVDLVDQFDRALEDDKVFSPYSEDENDVSNPSSESVDEMSKSWEDSLYKSFDKHVNADLKFYLNRLYRMSAPSQMGDTNYQLDDNNELGVPMTIGANYIIAQISNYASFYSVDDFIDSINRVAQTNPSLYGLSKMVNDMVSNRTFANKIFQQLANPKINKTIVTIAETGVDFNQSNRSADALGYMVFNMINQAKANFKDNYDARDMQIIKTAILSLGKVKNPSLFANSNTANEMFDTIDRILTKYFPKTDKQALRSYLFQQGTDVIGNYRDLLQNMSELINRVDDVVDSYNQAWGEFTTEYGKFAKRRNIVIESGEQFNEQPPIFDYTEVDYSKLDLPIINIAKKLVNFTAIKNELNSINAEGNMASDLIGNNFITNTLKQIAYTTPQDADAGLNALKDFITQTKQYDYSPFFFGVKDSRGNTIVQGLFDKDSLGNVTVNPNAHNLINISLFDGVKDRNNAKSAMYSGMSKGDYFLTQLVAFNSPVRYVTQTNNVEMAGYFMRTPSDAPKNFIVQAPKYSTDNLFRVVNSSRIAYLNSRQAEIAAMHNITNEGQFVETSEDIVDGSYRGNLTNNAISAEQLYDLLTSPIDNKAYSRLNHIYDPATNKVTIPLIYKDGEAVMIAYLQGDKVVDTVNNIAENLKVVEVYNPLASATEVFPIEFLGSINELVTQEGIANGQIERTIDRNNPAFRALYSHALGEVNNFINNLNNVFENKKGRWISKDDTTNLIDRAHFNGGQIVKDGRLTGNFFNFIRLFDTSGYSAGQELAKELFLYGQDSDIKGSGLINLIRGGKLELNLNRNDLVELVDGRISLNINEENTNLINDIVEKWLNAYYAEVVDRTSQYNTIIDGKYSTNDIVDYAINNAIMEMSFDDVFEGDAKFYKGTQDFLKRTKEVQAAGKAYAGFDFSNGIGGPINNITDRNGQEIPITIKGQPLTMQRRGQTIPMVARTGFTGVTIENTVRPSKQAGVIKQELIDILTHTIGKDDANRVATDIASGYFDKTKVNDAQSYITLEEFIQRRFADGTLDQYEDLISQLLDDSLTAADIDLKGVNARIQVQKNFYFDKQYDSNTDTVYPRQIKNAEFVLIPKLIKGTELEQLYNTMVEHGIDQMNTVEASKAAKKNTLVFWDNDGVVNKEKFDADVSARNYIAVEDYYYQYLYKQQDVIDHMVDEKNKAGIQIMKKIIDNSNEAVRPHIDNFFKAYTANIRDDFQTLLTNMGWKEQDGRLVDASGATNADGNPVIRFDEFYKKARIEAQRLGMDSNFIEYLTPDELGDPKMPNYMNNVSSKLESIAQSIFNNGVTRQTLPGWHGAQVTSVGHGAQTLDSNGEFRELRYHPQVTNEDGTVVQEAYAEVMIPRWSKLIPKDYDVSKLAEEGLDIHLGYRIPTEGKQSVSILKVVGFLDEVYGSTIMVPDEWVTQTGSDFDVDSVYGISYEMYKDRSGVIRKVQFDADESESAVISRYIKYVNRNIEYKIDRTVLSDEFIDDKIIKLRNGLKDLNERANTDNSFRELLSQEDAIYRSLDEGAKQIVKNINSKYPRGSNIIDKFNEISNVFSALADSNSSEIYREFADYNDALSYTASLSNELAEQERLDFKSAKSELLKGLFEDAKADYFKRVKNAAKEAGLISFNDFSKQSIEEQNTRQARNNRILDSMIAVMNDPNSREENYSRSNFDDLAGAMKKMNSLRGASSVARSSYNPLDQVDFMENAMSGATLKAFSVTRDTFNSVNNHINTKLGKGHEISVTYDLSKYNIDDLRNAYGNNVQVDPSTNTATVIHDRMANSNNNRNVVGKLLTVYSSQTTAHILDAVKEGTIFNENDYTFGTFKTLIDVGIDYDTAIAYLMQPGITNIVDAYFETKSIYINSSSNPVQTAIKRVASSLGLTVGGRLINDTTPNSLVSKAIASDGRLQQAFSDLFGAFLDIRNPLDLHTFTINGAMLEKRLKGVEISNNNTLSPDDKVFRDAAFDLAMIQTFDKIKKTTVNIEALARVSNPDRFGAKQTIRSTRKTLDNIREYADPTSPIAQTLRVDDQPIVNALYPEFAGTNNVNVNESKYPYLAAFLKYATIPSVDANSQLFPTESPLYNRITDTVEDRLGVRLTDEQYKEFKSYMMSDVYAGVPYLNSPLTINEFGLITFDNEAIARQTEDNKFYWNEERARIFGYDVTQSSSFTVDDINNPTQEDIAKFNALTPAQKVIWIQRSFKDGRGVFDFLDVNTFNQYEFKDKGFSSQTIKYSDSVEDIEQVYVAYRDSFFNKNPLIRLAAVDLAKYAFMVEGFKFKRGGISKIITNDAMYSNIEDKGLNLIDTINKQFFLYSNPLNAVSQRFIDKYIQSHSEVVKEVNIPKANKDKQGNENIGYKFARYSQSDNMLFIPFVQEAKDVLEYLTINEDNPKGYIRLSKTDSSGRRRTTLYKVTPSEEGVYFYPMNLLERNEVADVSANRKNNIYRSAEYYKGIIAKAVDNGATINQILSDQTHMEEIQVARQMFTIAPHKSKYVIETVENRNELIRLLNYGTSIEQAEINKLLSDVTDYINSPVEEALTYGVIRNDNRFIASLIPGNGSVVQNIPIGDDVVPVKITRYTKRNGLSQQFGWNLKGDKRGKLENIPAEERKAYDNAVAARTINPNLYKIERVTEQQEKEEYDALVKQVEEENASRMDAITNIIDDFDVDVALDFTDSDVVAKDLFNELYKRSLSNTDKNADTFRRRMDLNGVDRYSAQSIHDNKTSIYANAAEYYVRKSNEILSSINEFTTLDGETFSIDDPALYSHLTENKSDYPLLVKLVLDAKTFGDQFNDIMNLNLTGEDAETTKAIEAIRNAINAVRTSPKLKNAVNLLFNDYIANNYSTNPNVRNGLIELKTTFGDTDWFDLNFSDIGELNNKQVQTVVKYVNSILAEAAMDVAPKAANKFAKQYDAIFNRPGEFDMDKIVTPEGKLVTPYTDKFLEDRTDIIERLRNAEEEFGINSMEYAQAKLERDKWRAKNTQQEIVAGYYNANNVLTEKVLKAAPKEYLRYMELSRELYADTRPVKSLTAEEKDRRAEIQHELKQLTAATNADGSLKTEEGMYRAARLSEYREAKRKLNAEYFEYNESDGFKDTLKYYSNIVKNYEEAKPFESLEQRLANPTYQEAYDWIKANTVYTIDEASQEVINNAFKALKSEDNTNSAKIRKILKDANAYDDYGTLDPRKLSPEDIEKIKKLTEHKFSWTYDSNAGEAILIKEVPPNLPVLKDSFYRMLRGDGESDSGVNATRLKVIGEINKLLGRIVDKNTGQISSKIMFETLSADEINQLGSLYRSLHNIKGARNDKEARDRFKNHMEFKTNDAAFNREWAYAQQSIKGTRQMDAWLSIFVQTDKDGNYITNEDGSFVPNNDIFGYALPKDDTYVDKVKTAARQTVENDIQFVPTQYYYQALNEATANGTFNEWYNANHVFNPYTHKMEPLKVWTTMQVNPNGNIKGKYSYVPTYDNLERTVKDMYKNDNFKRYSTNYNVETGEYNNHSNLNEKERDMLELFQNTINAFATTHSMRTFADRGFLPRRAKYTPDGKWYAEQALGSMGLEFRNTGEKQWTDQVDYTHDFDADFDMMSLIKQKGYKEPLKIDRKGTYETQEEYDKRVADIRAKNKEIEADNLKLDNAVLDRDWKNVFQDFIEKGTEYNAKQKVKNTIYLLLEDLKDTPAYKESKFGRNLKRDNKRSTIETSAYQTVDQGNTHKLVENWARRILFNQFKQSSPYSKYADLMQNITSAKYMIFNVTGGIANIGTGLTNIYGEVFAKDYFDNSDFTAAQTRYFSNVLSFMKDMYSHKATTLTSGLVKMFDIVDLDAFTERRPNEGATERVKRVRDSLYAMQSGGEHYMQNVVMLSMLKSHRIYQDSDGTQRVGSLSNYNWNVEVQTLMGLLNGKDDLLIRYKSFLKSIKDDLNELRKYDTFSKDFNQEFLRDVGDKSLIKEYIAARKEALSKSEAEFKTNPLVEDQFELIDGTAVIKDGSPLTGEMLGELKQKVVSVNKKIHGVYDKIGAARIEKEWWGGLVMQYHKHLYPGIMKRYRTKGYYNEVRSSVEKGSYISLANLLGTEFRGLKDRVNNRVNVDNENTALASIKEVVKASVDTLLNLKLNYQTMPVWEQNNMRRALGDLLGVGSAFLIAIGVHLMTDDDEIKESELLSTALYMADRMNSESAMYFPWGLYSEAGTLWSSPIAAQNGPKDLLKGLALGANILFDSEFDPYYTTGLYKGQHKGAVLLYRNTPIYRVYQRLSTMTKNNQYYRINENTMNIRMAKTIADDINPDN